MDRNHTIIICFVDVEFPKYDYGLCKPDINFTSMSCPRIFTEEKQKVVLQREVTTSRYACVVFYYAFETLTVGNTECTRSRKRTVGRALSCVLRLPVRRSSSSLLTRCATRRFFKRDRIAWRGHSPQTRRTAKPYHHTCVCVCVCGGGEGKGAIKRSIMCVEERRYIRRGTDGKERKKNPREHMEIIESEIKRRNGLIKLRQSNCETKIDRFD